MNITLTGNLGSGKGSVSEIFKKWGFGYVSGGDVFRAVAKEKGLSVLEMNELAKKDRSIDDLIDARSTRLGDELDNTLFDSRLAWNFVRESFKVFLLVDTDESARRVFAGTSREMEEYANQDECADGLGLRANLERERFRKLYNIDYYDANNYDLVIESTNATPEQIAGEILRCFEEYRNEKYSTRIELNLKAMYPQQDLSEAELEAIENAAESKKKAAENEKKAAENEKKAAASEKKAAASEKKAAENEKKAVASEKKAAENEKKAVASEKKAAEGEKTAEAESAGNTIAQCSNQGQQLPDSTLASVPVRLISRNGYNYIDGDAAALMAEAASGKVFGRIESFRKDAAAATVPSSENLKKLEAAAGFIYRSLPEDKPVKHEYMMDLSISE